MEIKFFQKEVKLNFRISSGDDFPQLFIRLSNAVKEQGFQSVYFNEEEKNVGIITGLGGPVDRPRGYYCNITLMEEDEKNFYTFLQKFCEENKLTFRPPNIPTKSQRLAKMLRRTRD